MKELNFKIQIKNIDIWGVDWNDQSEKNHEINELKKEIKYAIINIIEFKIDIINIIDFYYDIEDFNNNILYYIDEYSLYCKIEHRKKFLNKILNEKI